MKKAVDSSIPLTKQPGQLHKDRWIYGPWIKEVNQQLNSVRKTYRRSLSNTTRDYLQSVVCHVHATRRQLRDAAWLEWCQSLGAHTPLGEMWCKLRTVYNPRPPPRSTHPDPQEEAERFAIQFATRS